MTMIFRYFGLVSLLTAAACGIEPAPDFGPDPDFSTIETKLRSPTGTTSETTMRDVIVSSRSSDSTADGKTTIGLRSLGTLDASTTLRDPTRASVFDGCSDIAAKRAEGTCSCRFGGEIDYAIEKNPQSGLVRVRLSSCKLVSGLPAVDGTMHVFLARPEGRSSYEIATADWQTRSPDGPVRYAPVTLREDGISFAPIPTEDGYVVVGRRGSTIIVRERDRTMECVELETAYRCTGSDGVELTVSR